MKLNFRTTKEANKEKGVRLVVTGITTDKKKKDLEEELNKKGIKAVVTSEPVLGVFDL